MTVEKKSSGSLFAWFLVILWSALIFLSVPFVRSLQEWVKRDFGSAIFGWITILGLLVGAAISARYAIRHANQLPVRNLLWLCLIGGVALFWAVRLWERPEEAVHLLEYGVLGFLLFYALKGAIPDALVFAAATFVGATIGLLDEVYQYVTPERYFDYRDIWLNAGAVGLVQLALWLGIPRDQELPRPAIKSVRRVLRIAVVFVLALALCLAATQPRLEAITERAPALARLLDPEDAISEYGFRHVFPQSGEFKSRFTLDELKQQDDSRGVLAGRVLNRHRYRYLEFLRIYTSAKAPFEHEAGVHLHSRDVNFSLAEKNKENPELLRRHATAAFRENQILEAFFPNTLDQSGAAFTPSQVSEVRQSWDPDLWFVSKAGRNIISFSSETRLRVLTIFLLLFLIATEIWLGRRQQI